MLPSLQKKYFERAYLFPTNARLPEVRLQQLLFAWALCDQVVVVVGSAALKRTWQQCSECSRLDRFVVVAIDELTDELRLRTHAVVIGDYDVAYERADATQVPFVFLPTISKLPKPVFDKDLRRIAVVGPECSGKSTLTAQLAIEFKTEGVPEYSRLMLEQRKTPCVEEDVLSIVLGQVALEDSLAVFATGILFCDTEPRISKIWSELLYGHFPQAYDSLLQRDYDQYLLTVPDLPWEADPLRSTPDGGPQFYSACEQLFAATGRPVSNISGLGDARFDRARRAILNPFN